MQSPSEMIRQDTEQLSLPHGRRVGQPGHEIALEYIRSRMREIKLKPFHCDDYPLPYSTPHPKNGLEADFTNLAGVIEGSDKSAMPILLGAHYDSAIDAPCSDDNAVSVALLLSIAEKLTEMNFSRNIIVAFFDAEENPYFLTKTMGSVRFYNDHCREIDFACVIIVDSVGHDFQTGNAIADTLIPGIRELLFILGSESHEGLPAIIEQLPSKKLRVIPTLNRYIGDRSDHHAFRLAGQPYLFLSKGSGKYSHKPLDTIDWINFSSVDRIQYYLLDLIKLLDESPMHKSRHMVDPAPFEIRMMRKAIGWPLPLLLLFMGFLRMSLRSRKDIDFVVEKLLVHVKLST